MNDPEGTSPEQLGTGDTMPPTAEATETQETIKNAEAAGAIARERAEEARREAAKAAEAGAKKAAEEATNAAEVAEAAAEVAEKAATKARAAIAPPRTATWGDAWPFLKKGFCDFWANMKRTWTIILVFIAYLLISTTLYWLLRVKSQVPSWHRALYNTWLSMSTAGELTGKSAKFAWAFGALNSLVGLVFFGFIVWLVTTSLYQAPNRG